MPIRGSPKRRPSSPSTGGRDRPERVVAINWNEWSRSIGIAGRDHPVRAHGRYGFATRFATPLALAKL